MVKLADAPVSGTGGLYGCGGSSPPFGTIKYKDLRRVVKRALVSLFCLVLYIAIIESFIVCFNFTTNLKRLLLFKMDPRLRGNDDVGYAILFKKRYIFSPCLPISIFHPLIEDSHCSIRIRSYSKFKLRNNTARRII